LVREIGELIKPDAPIRIPPGDIAILFRTNEQPRAFELELRRNKIPYVLVGGQSFYDRKEVRDILAYLKVVAHPNDEVSLLRIINTPARGIGAGAVQALLERAVAQGVPLWQVVSAADTGATLAAGVPARVAAFRDMICGYQQRLTEVPPSLVLREILQRIDYRAELQRVYKNPGDVEARWSSIEELVNSLALYEQRAKKPTLAEFLTETALAGREDQRDEEEQKNTSAISLMTLHSAKGLEFPHVYMVGMEEGLLPHQRSVVENRGVDEERRLCYVGVTRAKDALTLTLCRQRMKWGKVQVSIPSRFLLEMRGETTRAQAAAQAAEKLFRPHATPQQAPAARAAAKTRPSKKKSSRKSAQTRQK
jgi:DNA helicase-2/ATP-dependent DNA helicase PcrA